MKHYLKDYFINLGILLFMGGAIYLIFPDRVSRFFHIYGIFFVPILIIVMVIATLPRKRKGNKTNPGRNHLLRED